MPVHDWTRVEAGIYHGFHVAWMAEIRKPLNSGLLPSDFYALAEQHAGRSIADVLTLHASPASLEALPLPAALTPRGHSLAIRHVSGHRLVALLEIVSPANKDCGESVGDFAARVIAALAAGVHLLLVDLLPPGSSDPQGMHGIIWERLGERDEPYDLPTDEPLTLASYAADPAA